MEKKYSQEDFPAVENLFNILDELFLEISANHVYYHTFLNNLKERGNFTLDLLENVKVRIE